MTCLSNQAVDRFAQADFMDGSERHLNAFIRGMRPSATVAINERLDAMLAQGVDIIEFGLGQSPFPVPAPVVARLQEHAHERDTCQSRGFGSFETLCARLLESTGVAMLPGTGFGCPASDLTARLAYMDFDGAAALATAGPEASLDLDWLTQHCPRVIDGIERIAGWNNPDRARAGLRHFRVNPCRDGPQPGSHPCRGAYPLRTHWETP